MRNTVVTRKTEEIIRKGYVSQNLGCHNRNTLRKCPEEEV